MVASTQYGDLIEKVGVHSRGVSEGLHIEILILPPF